MPQLICVIDDDAHVRQTICMMLQFAGYEIVQADNGKDGLDEIRRTLPSLAVVDIIMPDHEGIETIGTIKARFPETKILSISGGGSVGAKTYLTMARGMGADATLPKPLRQESFLATVAHLIGKP